jgi:hypothetical protein
MTGHDNRKQRPECYDRSTTTEAQRPKHNHRIATADVTTDDATDVTTDDATAVAATASTLCPPVPRATSHRAPPCSFRPGYTKRNSTEQIKAKHRSRSASGRLADCRSQSTAAARSLASGLRDRKLR